ncbi:endoglucanase-5, partial [Neocallimastix californiae]
VTGGKTGKTTRYWDCCLASCSWKENTKASHPVNACSKDGRTVFSKFDWIIGSACSKGKGYMCSNNQPWAVNDNVAYGFVAAGFNGGSQKDWCCTCQRLEFTSGPIAGKQMVVQITNTGGDLSNNHFDIQMPGGGVGIFNGCSSQFGAPKDGWGDRYGGVKSAADCSQLPTELQEGCKWRFNWFKNADNPSVTFERVQCPKELTDITGCIPVDDASAKKLPW